MDLEANLAALGKSLADCETVLDFGCGAGRTLRWLIPQFPEVKFSGCDVDAQAIAWSGRHLARAGFRVNAATPPVDFPDACFDLIYAISVFTHLSLQHQKLWLAELHRLLRPGGLLLFTVHGTATWDALPAGRRALLERDGFLLETSAKLRGIVPEWYHTAFHTEACVRDLLGRHFQVLAYNACGMGYQDLVIAQRPG